MWGCLCGRPWTRLSQGSINEIAQAHKDRHDEALHGGPEHELGDLSCELVQHHEIRVKRHDHPQHFWAEASADSNMAWLVAHCWPAGHRHLA